MDKKIDISSTALEKGIDIAKDFVDKLIMPAIEETGLLIKERVTFWKFKNQVRMLNKAKEYCERNSIKPGKISLKLLCPLLDGAAIEEDDFLQDKWAILLSNMVDSEQNIESHVFPYILGQVSKNEFLMLESVYDGKIIRNGKLVEDHSKLILSEEEEGKLREEYQMLDECIKSAQESNDTRDIDIEEMARKRWSISGKIVNSSQRRKMLNVMTNKPGVLDRNKIREFELSNLIRLGLIREDKHVYAFPQQIEVPGDGNSSIEFDPSIRTKVELCLTELGELFMRVCKERKAGSSSSSSLQ